AERIGRLREREANGAGCRIVISRWFFIDYVKRFEFRNRTQRAIRHRYRIRAVIFGSEKEYGIRCRRTHQVAWRELTDVPHARIHDANVSGEGLVIEQRRRRWLAVQTQNVTL